MAKELMVIELTINIGDAEIRMQAEAALAFRDRGGKKVGCCLTGFAHDPRPLSQIPSACAFFRRLWDTGFASVLHQSFWIPPTDTATENCLGAVEVWAFGRGLAHGGRLTVDAKKYKRYVRDLKRSNDVLASHLEQQQLPDSLKEFLRDHPEYRDQVGVPIRYPDGVTRPSMTVPAAEALARWAVLNGKADERKCLSFLTDILPEIRDRFPPRESP